MLWLFTVWIKVRSRCALLTSPFVDPGVAALTQSRVGQSLQGEQGPCGDFLAANEWKAERLSRIVMHGGCGSA